MNGAKTQGPAILTVTPEEWMRLTGMGRTATYRGMRNGEIPAVKIGRKYMIKRAAVERMFADESGAGSPTPKAV